MERGKLSSEQKEQIIELLKTTNQPYAEIGMEFGVSRQFVQQVCKEKKIKRKMVLIENHRIDRCSVCKSIIDKAKSKDILTTKQLAESLGITYPALTPHLGLLRKHKKLPKDFCFFRSRKVVEAIKRWKENPVSARQIGLQTGVANFSGILWRARQKGFTI